MSGSSRLPSLAALSMFSVAARHLSFTRAADELCVTQGAVSRQVLQLEAFYGRLLFVRHPKGLILTEAGRQLATVVSESLEAIRVVSQQVCCAPHQLRVLVPTCLMRWAMPILIDFRSRFPGAALAVTTTIRHDFSAAADDCDVGLVYDRLDRADANCVELFAEELTPVCAPAFLKHLPLPLTAGALAEVTLLHATRDHADWKRWLAAAGIDAPAANHGMDFDTLDLSIHAAMSGYGMALGDLVVSGHDLRQGTLERPFRKAVRTGHGYFMAWRSGHPLVARLREDFVHHARAADARPAARTAAGL